MKKFSLLTRGINFPTFCTESKLSIFPHTSMINFSSRIIVERSKRLDCVRQKLIKVFRFEVQNLGQTYFYLSGNEEELFKLEEEKI